MTALLLALLLLFPAQALASKKGAGPVAGGNMAFYEEFVVVDGAVSPPQHTSFVKRKNTHLVLANSAGATLRVYVPAGFKLIINRVSYTLGESHEPDDCSIRIFNAGVAQIRTQTSTGTSGEATTCEFEIDPAGDHLLIAAGDSCTRSFPNNPIVFEGAGYLTVGWTTVGAGTCDDIHATRIAISGFWVTPGGGGKHQRQQQTSQRGFVIGHAVMDGSVTAGTTGIYFGHQDTVTSDAFGDGDGWPVPVTILAFGAVAGDALNSTTEECFVAIEKDLVRQTASDIALGEDHLQTCDFNFPAGWGNDLDTEGDKCTQLLDIDVDAGTPWRAMFYNGTLSNCTVMQGVLLWVYGIYR